MGTKPVGGYFTEDLLAEACNIELLPHRKKNSKRSVPAYVEYLQQVYRKKISGGIQRPEAATSSIDSRGHGSRLRTESVPVRACLQHRCTAVGRNLGYVGKDALNALWVFVVGHDSVEGIGYKYIKVELRRAVDVYAGMKG